MPLFRRRSSAAKGDGGISQGPPALPDLALPGLASVLDLSSTYGSPSNDEADGSSGGGGGGAASNAYTLQQPLEQLSHPFSTATSIPSTPPRHAASASLASPPSGVPQFHRPWTREGTASFGSTNSPSAAGTLGSPVRGPPPSSFRHHGSISSPPAAAPSRDFRQSPNAFPPASPAARRAAIEAGRSMSLRRSKAPTSLNVLVAGAKGCGKTSWIRTLVESCVREGATLGEVDAAIVTHGLPASALHPNRLTNPPTPQATKTFSALPPLELSSSVLAASTLLPFAGIGVAPEPIKRRPASMVSSMHGGSGASRIVLSFIDTPGLEFGKSETSQPSWDTERRVREIVREIEARLSKTLAEESKVTRAPRSDAHIDVVLYFVDVLSLVRLPVTRSSGSGAAAPATPPAPRRTKSSAGEPFNSAEKRRRSLSESNHKASVEAARAVTLGRTSGARAAAPLDEAEPAGGVKASLESALYEEDEEIEENEEEEDDTLRVLSIAPAELKAIVRLAARANVVPVLARADLLTAAGLLEARTAVRNSLASAGLGMGVFESEYAEDEEEEVVPRRRGAPRRAASRDDVLESAADGDEESDHEGVKLVRIRSRRSFSAAGDTTPGATKRATAEEAGLTAPLFDAPPDIATPEGLSKQVPGAVFALFAPEPVALQLPPQARHKRAGSAASINGFAVPASGANAASEAAKTGDEVPPVPPLPRNLSLGAGSLKTTGAASSDSAVAVSADETPASAEAASTTESVASPTPGASEDAPASADATVDPAATGVVAAAPSSPPSASAATNGARPTTPKLRALTSAETTRILRAKREAEVERVRAQTQPRFERSYRWGEASVLDPQHTDFSILRTCLLSTHVEALKAGTREKYESYRSSRLSALR